MNDIGIMILRRILGKKPHAIAIVRGGSAYPELEARVLFYQTQAGVLCLTEAQDLPGGGFFGMHIHEGGSCTGNAEDEFADVGTHYNPEGDLHPYHAGDLPPLLSNNGYAVSGVLTDRFSVADIIGRAVIIHSDPDDFTTQPAGNSGKKIACGIIYKI